MRDRSLQSLLIWFQDRRAVSMLSEAFLSVTLLYGLLGFAYDRIELFGIPVIHRSIWPILLTIALSYLLLLLFIGRFGKSTRWRWLYPITLIESCSLLPLVGAALFIFGSSVVHQPYGFFVGGISFASLLWGAGLVTGLLALRGREPGVPRTQLLLLLAGSAVLFWCFSQGTHGSLLFRDDHPSFLYRFALLKEHFPSIPFYNLDWNSGYWAREFFAVGVLNIFLLTLPFQFFFDLTDYQSAANYNFIVPFISAVLLPLSTFGASRLFGLRHPFIAALLACGATIGLYEWLFKYGTLGFSTSVALLPLSAALLYRLLFDDGRPRGVICIGAVVTTSLMVLWSLSAVALIPLAVIALYDIRRVLHPSRAKRLLYCGLVLVTINLPWMVTFVQESKVFEFVSKAELPGTHDVSGVQASKKVPLSVGIGKLREQFGKYNPVLLVFSVAGLVLLFPRRRLFLFLIGTVLWLYLLVVLGEVMKPQLEPKRLAIFAAILLALPAAEGVGGLIKQLQLFRVRARYRRSRFLSVFGEGVVFGTLLLTAVNLGAIHGNRSVEQHRVAPAGLEKFVQVLRSEGDTGRVFFLGFVLHELGETTPRGQDGGHLAPLPLWTGREFYAFDFTHAKWSSVDPIPSSFRRDGTVGIERFLSLNNVSTVVTFRREWVRYCLQHPSYQEIYRDGRLHVFRRNGEHSYILKGEGKLRKLARNRIEVQPQSTELTLKYRYHPRLVIMTGADTESGTLDAGTLSKLSLSGEEVFTEELGGNKNQSVSFIRLSVPEEFVKSGRSFVVGTP